MYSTLCTYPLSSDLFAQSLHPSEPLIALGLASGHVQVHRLPDSLPTDPSGSGSSYLHKPSLSKQRTPSTPALNGYGTITTSWRTRRHQGSCRTLSFSHDGRTLFSAGTDGIVKVADTETGKVGAKVAVPFPLGETTPGSRDGVDEPTTLCPLSRDVLLLATEGRALHLVDVRGKRQGDGERKGVVGKQWHAARPANTWRNVHSDYVTSISPLSGKDGGEARQFVTTGGGTVAMVDVRKGVVLETEEVEEELLTSVVGGGKLVVGGESGKMRMWDVGAWDKETVQRAGGDGVGIEMLAAIFEEDEQQGTLAVGGEDGTVRFAEVRSGKKSVVKMRKDEVKHDELDGVTGLGWVPDGRLVSGGGQTVKIWEREVDVNEDEKEVDVDGVGDTNAEPDDSTDEGKDDSSEEEKQPRKKKRKKGKGKGAKSNIILGFSGSLD